MNAGWTTGPSWGWPRPAASSPSPIGVTLIENSPPPQDHHRNYSSLGLSQSQPQVFTKIGAHFRQRSLVKMGYTRISRRLAMAFGTTLGISGIFGTNKNVKARFRPGEVLTRREDSSSRNRPRVKYQLVYSSIRRLQPK